MSITTVTRFKIDRQEAIKLAKDATPLMKQQGASGVRIGYCHSGEHCGHTLVVVTYPDWDTYGRAMTARAKDAAYQKLFAQVLKTGELLDRSIMEMTEL